MKKIFSFVVALGLLAGLGFIADLGFTVAADGGIGTVWFVAEGGAGTKDGTNWSNALATIQEAVDVAKPGDTIMVAGGEYDAFMLREKSNIGIISTEGATVTTTNLITALPVVGNAWVMAAVYRSQNVNIKGINFDGTRVEGQEVFVGIAYVDSTGRIADVTVENVIATGLGAGVAVIGHAGTCVVEMMEATISKNGHSGIYVCGESTVEAHFNKIFGNSQCGLLNDGAAVVHATYNWWGDRSGPLHQTNPLGKGDAVVGNVDFKPWLGAAPAVVKTQTVTSATVDAKAQADTEVVATGTATVAIAKLVVEGSAQLPEYKQLNLFRDVRVTDVTPGSEIEIRLYYTDAEAQGFDEESLRLFWWNGTSWQPVSPEGASGVSTADTQGYSGYMWARITATTVPSLADLQGTPWGGYGHPREAPQPCCFIATAALGTDTAEQLDIVRKFRDEVLLSSTLGAKLVSLYYETSPPLASFLSQHEVARTAVRVGFVDVLVAILNWTHDLWSARAL